MLTGLTKVPLVSSLGVLPKWLKALLHHLWKGWVSVHQLNSASLCPGRLVEGFFRIAQGLREGRKEAGERRETFRGRVGWAEDRREVEF